MAPSRFAKAPAGFSLKFHAGPRPAMNSSAAGPEIAMMARSKPTTRSGCRVIQSVCIRAHSWRSEHTVSRPCRTWTFSRVYGGIERVPCAAWIAARRSLNPRSTSPHRRLIFRIGRPAGIRFSTLIKLTDWAWEGTCPRKPSRRCHSSTRCRIFSQPVRAGSQPRDYGLNVIDRLPPIPVTVKDWPWLKVAG
jgi:hypothetical protein